MRTGSSDGGDVLGPPEHTWPLLTKVWIFPTGADMPADSPEAVQAGPAGQPHESHGLPDHDGQALRATLPPHPGECPHQVPKQDGLIRGGQRNSAETPLAVGIWDPRWFESIDL